MKLPTFGSFRGWHIWLSIALSVPILIVGITAIFIAHDKSLDLKSMQVPAYLSPASQPKGKAAREELELRSVWQDAHGWHWLGGKSGLYRVSGPGELSVIAGPTEVRALLGTSDALLVAAKNGLWRVAHDGRETERVQRGDFHGLSTLPEGIAAIPQNDAILLTRDGGLNWSKASGLTPATETLANFMSDDSRSEERNIPVSKLIMDLHTGKAFFGKKYEWIWIDLVGGAMALLTLTGLVMWWRSQRRKVAQLQAQLDEALAATPTAAAEPARQPA